MHCSSFTIHASANVLAFPILMHPRHWYRYRQTAPLSLPCIPTYTQSHNLMHGVSDKLQNSAYTRKGICDTGKPQSNPHPLLHPSRIHDAAFASRPTRLHQNRSSPGLHPRVGEERCRKSDLALGSVDYIPAPWNHGRCCHDPCACDGIRW